MSAATQVTGASNGFGRWTAPNSTAAMTMPLARDDACWASRSTTVCSIHCCAPPQSTSGATLPMPDVVPDREDDKNSRGDENSAAPDLRLHEPDVDEERCQDRHREWHDRIVMGAVLLFPREDQQAVRRNHNRGGVRQSLHAGSVGKDLPAIARDHWIWKVIVEVAVENLSPAARPRKSDSIPVERELVEARNDHDVLTDAFDPALKCHDAIDIVMQERVNALASERRQLAAQRDEVGGERHVVRHLVVVLVVEPAEEDVQPLIRVVAPLFVFEELLTHKQLRDTRRRQQQPGRNPRAAA